MQFAIRSFIVAAWEHLTEHVYDVHYLFILLTLLHWPGRAHGTDVLSEGLQKYCWRGLTESTGRLRASTTHTHREPLFPVLFCESSQP